MSDLTEVIEDSLTDATLPEPEVEEVEAQPEATPEEVVEPQPEAVETTEVKSPAAKVEEPEPSDFDKKYGLQQISPSGRENRIPYSRVKKIADNAVKDAKASWDKDIATHPKYVELETKVKDYEGRLVKVSEFEQVLLNDPATFLRDVLARIPAYKPLFDILEQQQAPQAQPPVTPQQEVSEEMPQPDQKLSDGSMVYSLEGLKALNAWNRAQARKETISEVEKRFGPIEEDWKTQQRIQAVIPKVQAQIDTARKWRQFTENEAEIVKVLQSDPNISLEAAYQQVVLPKLEKAIEDAKASAQVERNKVREEVLKELKGAPTSTSVTSGASRPNAQTSGGPKTLEEIIAESIKVLKQ